MTFNPHNPSHMAALRAACEAGYLPLVEYLEVYESIYPRVNERRKLVLRLVSKDGK